MSNFKRKHAFSEPRPWKKQITSGGGDQQFYIVPWASPFFGKLYVTHLIIANLTAGAGIVKIWDEHIGFAGMNAAKRGDNAADNVQITVPASDSIEVDLDEFFQAGIAIASNADVQVYATMECVGN